MSYSRINGSGLGLSMAAAAHLMGIFLMLNFIDTDTGLHIYVVTPATIVFMLGGGVSEEFCSVVCLFRKILLGEDMQY